MAQREKLVEALRGALAGVPPGPLAGVLFRAAGAGKISYEEAKNLASDEAGEVLLLAFDLRLLVPVRSSNDSFNWSDALLVCQPGEVYRMPNLSRHLVLSAAATGRWELEGAVAAVFREMGGPDAALMPALVRRLCRASAYYRVNALEINTVCREAGLGDRVGSLILILKGAGVISPKFDSYSDILSSKSPVYEINKALFLGPGAVKSTTL
jgi:hypothetical protein